MKILYFVICTMMYLNVFSQKLNPLIIDASYIGDGFGNFSGGLKTGYTYLGKIHFGVSKLYKNSEFAVSVENTHGGNPSKNFIGDIQVASNIDNGNYTYLSELWYKYTFHNFFAKIGVIDLNSDYLTTDCGGLFLNSSFGIQPSASLNMPVPIFPVNSLGINLQYNFNKNFLVRTGVWDGNPGSLDENKYNLQWNISKTDGILSATEFEYNFDKGSSKAKIGVLYHSAKFQYLNNSSKFSNSNFQYHLIIEKNLIRDRKSNTSKLGCFTTIGYLPNLSINTIPFSFAGGINIANILFNDKLGLAFSYSKLNNTIYNNAPNETAIELTYSVKINDNIYIQPDLQYIINPGEKTDLKNAFVGFFRVIIEN